MFRLGEFKRLNSPNFFIDTESKILDKYMEKLNTEQIAFVKKCYIEYEITARKEDEIQKINIQVDFENYIKNIN